MSRPTLESLPLDVSYNILSYLYAGAQDSSHPYLALSAVCRNLNGLVETYSSHILTTRLANTSGPVPISRPTSRQRLLRHVWKHCEFCGKKTTRRATMASFLACCKVCDKQEWDEKITMTDAMKKYYLKKQDLFASRIRSGKYYGVNGMTTLFLEPEVRELATRIHVGAGNDIEPFLVARISKSLERKAARANSREAKKNHLRRALIANGLIQPPNLINSLAQFLEPGRDRRPAMPVLEIVRMKLLQQRLQTENLHLQPRYDRFRDSRDKALFELFCREFDLLPPPNQTNAEEGRAEAEDRIKFYELHRKEWAWTSTPEGVPSMLRKQIIISSSRRDSWETTVSILNEPPWSWACFPVLVKDAAATLDPDHTTDPKEVEEAGKELNRINRWNEKAESEMARITALIKERGLDKKLWGRAENSGPEVEVIGPLQELEDRYHSSRPTRA